MNTEDFQADVRQERHDEERAARQRADDIAAARDDLISEARTLRRLETLGNIENRPWWESKYRLADITDRLNELEGAAS